MTKTKKPISKILIRTPRILAIIFILFLALFSLDIFGNGYTVWQTIVGLFMHNIPSMLLTTVLIMSRKHEIVGAVAFMLFGVAYIIMTLMGDIQRYLALSRSMILAGPAILTGALFLNIRYKKRTNRKIDK